MTVSSDTLALLMKAGLAGEALLEVVRSIENDNPPAPEKPVSGSALRMRRLRARQAEEADSVTQTVTSDVTCDATRDAKSDAAPSSDKRNPQTPKKINSIPGECDAHAREADPSEGIVAEWNAMAKRVGLPLVGKLTDERRKHIRARLADHSREHFTEAIAAVERSSFCRGASEGGWRANFDFLLQPSSFTKLLEGAYDRSSSSNGRSRFADRPSAWAAAPGFAGLEPASLDD